MKESSHRTVITTLWYRLVGPLVLHKRRMRFHTVISHLEMFLGAVHLTCQLLCYSTFFGFCRTGPKENVSHLGEDFTFCCGAHHSDRNLRVRLMGAVKYRKGPTERHIFLHVKVEYFRYMRRSLFRDGRRPLFDPGGLVAFSRCPWFSGFCKHMSRRIGWTPWDKQQRLGEAKNPGPTFNFETPTLPLQARTNKPSWKNPGSLGQGIY